MAGLRRWRRRSPVGTRPYEGRNTIIDTARAAEALLLSGMRRRDESVTAAIDWLIGEVGDRGDRFDTAEAAAVLSSLAAWLAAEHACAADLPPSLSVNRDSPQPSGAESNVERVSRVSSAGACVARRLAALSTDELTAGEHLGALACWRAASGQDESSDAVASLANCLLNTQLANGSWVRRVGRAIEATSAAVIALLRCGVKGRHPSVLSAANWLLAEQGDAGLCGRPARSREAATSQRRQLLSGHFRTRDLARTRPFRKRPNC